MTAFADRLIEAARSFGPLCIGLDPHPQSIPKIFGEDPLSALNDWCEAIVTLASRNCGVLKPQIGLFEPYGPEGMVVYQSAIRSARELGMIVISDAKRGDIGSTACGYARAYLEANAAFESDAVTLNPYLGQDSIEPFLEMAREHDKGLVILGRTSNPGAEDIQTLKIGSQSVYESVVSRYAAQTEILKGESGWSGLMWVVGATAPEAARRIRQISPSSLFLIPGFGVQGGGLEDAFAGFVRSDATRQLEGGVINASRSVTASPDALTANTYKQWQETIQNMMSHTQKQLKVHARLGE